jgi:DNA polymerase I-like protein with 3'-5' exonuclease and polymerase domains
VSELRARLLRNDGQIELLARAITNAPRDAIVAHDTETAGSPEAVAIFGEDAALYPYAGSYCTGISFCLVDPFLQGAAGLTGYYVPVGHRHGNASPRAVGRLCHALGVTAAKHLLHHANFDWEVLEHLDKGYRPSPRTLDTQVMRWLDDENQPKALKVMGEMYLDEDASKEKRELGMARAPNLPEGWKQTETYRHIRASFPELPVAQARNWARELRRTRGWGDITVEEMMPYAARDATMTYQLGEVFLGHEGMLHPSKPLQREMDLQPVLHAMTKRGVGVDIDRMHAAGKLYQQRADAITAELDHSFGTALRKRFGPKTYFNPRSSDQVAWLLFDKKQLGLRVAFRTKSGAPSTAAGALETLEGNTVVADIMAARRAAKAASGYCTPFARFAEMSPDGRIHSHFSSTRTVTGRLSSSGPNMMTIPKDNTLPELRACFYKCAPGFARFGFDLKSAELWVTAHMTSDPYLIQVLQGGGNMHTDMMLQAFGGEPDKDRREYTIAKNVNYSMAYEAGLQPIRIYVAKGGYGPDEVDRIAHRLLNAHKKLFARQHYVSRFLTDKARTLGKLPMHVPGRFRHFNSPGVMVEYYTALNAMVQGGIAEYMKSTMLELVRRGNFADFLVLQVHDELVFDAPDEPGMSDAILAELTAISEEINPFKYVLQWEGKPWASTDA